MIDIQLLRVNQGGNPEIVKESQRRRFASVELVDEVIDLDEQWRAANHLLEEKRCTRNKMEKASTKKIIQASLEEKEQIRAEQRETVKQLRDSISLMEKEVEKLKSELDLKLGQIGNLVHHSVPVANDEKENMVLTSWGDCRRDQGLRNHVELVTLLGIADTSIGPAVAGGRGYYLKGDGVRLNMALINYGISFLAERGYCPVMPPFFMRKSVMAKCAQLSQFDDELYKLAAGEEEEKYLIATAEQPLCALHHKCTLQPNDLPLRYAGYSSCFRREAGSHGRDTLGIFRVHQFEKVEQFCITSPLEDKSWEMLEEMLKNSEDFYKELGIPFRVVSIVSGALNDAAAKKYDLEAWFPASATYRELVSCSNCTDYQSRNLEIKYMQTGKFVHLLNSTLTATERTICCILENFQTESGVRIPKVLQPFMGGKEFLSFV